jgi:hypothetical protein
VRETALKSEKQNACHSCTSEMKLPIYLSGEDGYKKTQDCSILKNKAWIHVKQYSVLRARLCSLFNKNVLSV